MRHRGEFRADLLLYLINGSHGELFILRFGHYLQLHLPELRQFRQRIVVSYHLSSLNLQECIQYIFYRLKVAGGMDKVKFTRRAINEVFQYSKGIPRLINIICDSLGSGSFTLN